MKMVKQIFQFSAYARRWDQDAHARSGNDTNLRKNAK